MHPLIVRTEIDGFVADRLLEALWREALWLVHDDVATVAEIDDAIRYGAGLRWAFMGTFLDLPDRRRRGGHAPLPRRSSARRSRWPWTKLTDVPELTDELIDKLAAQSDDAGATGGRSRELERVRDDALVALLQALRAQEYGAGETLAALGARAARARAAARDSRAGALRLHGRACPPTGSTTTATSTRAATCRSSPTRPTRCSRTLGLDAAYLAAGGSYFTVETHLSHLRQLEAGDARLA